MQTQQYSSELLCWLKSQPYNTDPLESLLASANKSSLADTARVKRWLGRPLSLQEILVLLEEL